MVPRREIQQFRASSTTTSIANIAASINILQQTKAQLEAVERNRKILYSEYIFKRYSPLQPYIKRKINEDNNQACLATILNQLKNIIKREGLFDFRNPSIILCSEELDQAIGMRALHVTEIRELVLSHLQLVKESTIPPPDLPLSSYTASATIRNSASSIGLPLHRNVLPDDYNLNTQFNLKEKFRACLETVPTFNKEQTNFTIPQVSDLLSNYITMKKNELFDPRNIKLALVRNDPLGEAFGVSAFHRTQVQALLRTQLIPIGALHPADGVTDGAKKNTRTRTRPTPSPPRTRSRTREAAGPAARTRSRKIEHFRIYL